MPKHKGIYKLFRTKGEFEAYEEAVRHFTRLYTLDDVTIALGRMGFRETKFREFQETLATVQNENSLEAITDYKDDKQIWYHKAKKDQEIKSYVGSLFVPWEERLR